MRAPGGCLGALLGSDEKGQIGLGNGVTSTCSPARQLAAGKTDLRRSRRGFVGVVLGRFRGHDRRRHSSDTPYVVWADRRRAWPSETGTSW